MQKSSWQNFFGDAGTYGLIYLYFLLDGKIKLNQNYKINWELGNMYVTFCC